MNYMLVDLNQVLIGQLVYKLLTPKKSYTEREFRITCLEALRHVIKKFKSEYSEIILCTDNKKFWRKEYFPYYKSHRKEQRKASGYDWPGIFQQLNQIQTELKENFPYKLLDVPGAEADDVIAVLAKKLSSEGSVLIVSGDGDFVQLQKYPNVKQFAPNLGAHGEFIKTDDPHRYLKEHIIRGDRGDGIPNILSPPDSFIKGERQKSINSNRLEEWISKDVAEFCNTPDMVHRFHTNSNLIDFDYIPASIESSILENFEEEKKGSAMSILNYLIAKGGMETIIPLVPDFVTAKKVN